jgi:hypothetical protein
MNKEDILAAARGDKDRGKEYESNQSKRGGLLGSGIALFVGMLLFLLEFLVRGTPDFGLLAVGMTSVGVQFLYEGITVRKAWMIIAGVVWSALAILFIMAFLGQVVAV